MPKHWFSDAADQPNMNVDRGISYALAVAIGHPESRIALSGDNVQIALWDVDEWKAMREQGRAPTEHLWRTFDYRDPLIAWAIAKHFGCWPQKSETKQRWYCKSYRVSSLLTVCDHGPEQAVAQYVIAVAERLGGVWRL